MKKVWLIGLTAILFYLKKEVKGIERHENNR